MTERTQMDRIEAALIGNGHEGLLARTARIEENQKMTIDLSREAKEKAAEVAAAYDAGFERTNKVLRELTVQVEKVVASVEAHHKTEHLSDIVRANPTFALMMEAMKDPHLVRNIATVGIVGFLSLHLVATYLPNVWDWAMLLLGLPKLIIPLN